MFTTTTFTIALSVALAFASPVPQDVAARESCDYSTPQQSVIDTIYRVALSRNVNSKVYVR